MIKLSEILSKIEYKSLRMGPDTLINGVTNNSLKVEKDFIFVAVKGSIFDGHKYILDAIKNGAAAIVHSEDVEFIPNITYIRVENPREIFAKLSNIISDYPSRKMDLVAVTGTNGKTTTSKLAAYLIERLFGPCANIGTDGANVAGEIIPTSNTTPDITEVNRILTKCLDKGIKYLTLEASSHGLDQGRLSGIDFKVGIFNNLSTEHLDYHKTMEAYFKAKMILLENSEIKIVNADDEWGQKALSIFPDAISFGKSDTANIRAVDIEKSEKTMNFSINGVKFKLNTIADFELYNNLAAIAALKMMGASLTDIAGVITDFPGVGSRFEYIENDLGINLVVDFAHTPRAYEEIFKSLPEDAKKIAVFGIQGDRNEEFRALIGKTVSDFDIYAMITTDDPKFDSYENISKDIVAGFRENYGAYSLVKEREDAIRSAIKMAKPGDYVLCLGKGEEDFIKLHGNEKTPYKEKETIRRVLEDL